MASQTFETRLVISGDGQGGVRAISSNRRELQQLNQIQQENTRLTEQQAQTWQSVTTVLKGSAAAMGLSVAGVVAMGQSQLEAVTNTDNLARSIGIQTTTLQSMQYASKQVGLESDNMGDILKDVADKIGDAYSNGGGEAIDVLNNMGLSAQRLVAMSPDQQLLAIAGGLDKLQTQAQKVNALEALGNDASRLLPLLENNGAELQRLMQRARDVNFAMDPADIDVMVEANKALIDLQGTATGLFNTLTVQLAPGITDTTQALQDWIDEAGGARAVMDDVADGIDAAMTLAGALAAVMGGRLLQSWTVATAGAVKNTIALHKNQVAGLEAARAATRRSAAEQASARALLSTAKIEAQATRGTNAHGIAVQNLIGAHERAAAATALHNQNLAATSAAARNANIVLKGLRGTMALLGGPGGLVLLGAYALYELASSSSEASQASRELASKLTDMKTPLSELTEEWKNATAAQRAYTLESLSNKIDEQADAIESSAGRIRATFRNYGVPKDFDSYSVLNDVTEKMQAGTIDSAEALDVLRGKFKLFSEKEGQIAGATITELAANIDTLRDSQGKLIERDAALKGRMNDTSEAVDHAGSSVEKLVSTYDKAHIELTQLLNDRSNLQSALAKDPGNEALKRSLEEVNDQIEKLTTDKKAQALATKAATQAEKDHAQALKASSEVYDKLLGSISPVGKAQAEYREEVDQLSLSLRTGQKNQLEYYAAVGAAALKFNEARDAALGYRSQQQLVDTYLPQYGDLQQLGRDRERVSQLDGGMADLARGQIKRKVAAVGTEGAPQVSGLSDERAGAFGELNQIGRERDKYEQWYQEQLSMLREFEDEKYGVQAEAAEARRALEDQHLKTIQQTEQAMFSARMQGYESLFGNIADVTKTFAGENNAIYQAMFTASKAFAIADAIVKIQQGIASAASLPFPANIPAMATVAASTAGIVSTIQSTNLTGMAHNGIDSVPREGTWLLDGGERVLNPNQNRDLTEFVARENRTAQQNTTNNSRGGDLTINVPVSVQAQAGVSDQDARRQGKAVGDQVKGEVLKVLRQEQRPGGMLHRG